MIGLGGGSLVKFCRRHLPLSNITVVENNPGVIALRREFGIPDDDDRLRVIADDGAAWLSPVSAALDVLLVDGFDRDGQPAQLCSQGFYDQCFRALRPGGLLVVNLHADHPQHEQFCRRIAASARNNAVQVLSSDKSNSVVLAGKRRPVTVQSLRAGDGAGRLAPELRGRLRREFDYIGWNACALRVRG
jgi:spermidine synthase